MKITDAQKARLKELLRNTKRNEAEETELKELQALATKDGYDAAAEIKAEDAAVAQRAAATAQPVAITMTPEAFQKAITDGIATAMKPLEDRLKKVEDLRAAGVPGASWNGKAASAAANQGEEGTILDQFNKITDPVARAEFYRKNKAALLACRPAA